MIRGASSRWFYASFLPSGVFRSVADRFDFGKEIGRLVVSDLEFFFQLCSSERQRPLERNARQSIQESNHYDMKQRRSGNRSGGVPTGNPDLGENLDIFSLIETNRSQQTIQIQVFELLLNSSCGSLERTLTQCVFFRKEAFPVLRTI